MPSLSYKSKFVEYVENGLKTKRKKSDRIKRQTIRNFRKVPIKVGDKLYHFFGMRTKWCRRLGESVCTSVEKIVINHHAVFIGKNRGSSYKEITNIDELNKFAYEDGFEDWKQMKLWWTLTHGAKCFPFVGQLIKW